MPKTGFGRIAPPVSQAAGGSPVQKELINALQTISTVDAIQKLRQPADAGGPPQSIQDILSIHKTLAEQHQASAALAAEREAQARQEVQQLKEEQGSAYEAGQRDAEKYHTLIAQMMETMHKMSSEQLEKSYQAQLASLESRQQGMLADINSKLELALKVKDAEIEKVRAEAEAKERTREAERQFQERLAVMEKDYAAQMAKFHSQVSDPQTLRMLKWAEFEPTVWKDKHDAEMLEKEDKAAQRQELTKLARDGFQTLSETIKGLTGKNASDAIKNGLPSGPPQEAE